MFGNKEMPISNIFSRTAQAKLGPRDFLELGSDQMWFSWTLCH